MKKDEDIKDKEVLFHIKKLRKYIKKEFLVKGCVEEPCIGCISCNIVEIERKLHALENMIELS